MKLALIPPIPNLDDFAGESDYHLLLAHLFKDERYVSFYRKRQRLGDFLILDNGAHEGRHIHIHDVLSAGRRIGAHEVVIPDAPHDRRVTVRLFESTLVWLETEEGTRQYNAAGRPRLMFVPQVEREPTKRNEYIETATYMYQRVAFLSSLPLNQFTLGIALMYEDLEGGIWGLVNRLHHLIPNIHLLGWSRKLNTPTAVAWDFPNVRSVDTCKPFVYARDDTKIAVLVDDRYPYPGRPDDYFDKPLTPEEIDLARINISRFKSAVQGVPKPGSLVSPHEARH